jgi:hypothetical protein
MRTTRHDLTNQTFGYLTVIGPRRSMTYGRAGRFKSEWLCRCSCGKEVWRQADALIQGQSDSCGCQRIARTVAKISKAHQAAAKANRSHGMSTTPIYRRWASMLQRCYNPMVREYRWYGAVGITICDRWRESFENFFTDMSEGYSEGLSLERKDSKKGYSPENCCWIPRSEQSRNTSRNIRLTETLTISDFCKIHNVAYDLVWHTYYLKTLHPVIFDKLIQILDNKIIT